MRIAINTRNLLEGKMEGFGHYTYELCKRIVLNHPEHEFYFIFDRPYSDEFIFSNNIIPIVLGPPTRHPFLWFLWFEIRLKSCLIKHKIDLFWSPDGFLNLRTKVPQLATIHDLNFVEYPKDLPFLVRKYYNYFFPKFCKKACHIVTVSEYSKQEIISKYNIKESKICVIYNSAAEHFQPVNVEERIQTQKEISNGKEYFLFVGSIHPRKNVQRLLKGFAQFASTNETIDLVIVGKNMWKGTALNVPDSISKRVHFTGYVNKEYLARITSSAYALTYVPYYEGFGIPMIEAMRCKIPIIAANSSCLPEIAGNAALYCNPFEENDISEKMKQLMDTELYNRLALNSFERAKFFSWDRAAEQIWKELNRLIEKKFV